MTPEEIEKLNPGIRKLVALLREAGFDTCDSGDGRTHDCECDRDFPYVVMQVDAADMKAESDRLCALLQSKGVDMQEQSMGDTPFIQATYDPVNGLAFIDVSNVDDSMLSGDAPS